MFNRLRQVESKKKKIFVICLQVGQEKWSSILWWKYFEIFLKK